MTNSVLDDQINSNLAAVAQLEQSTPAGQSYIVQQPWSSSLVETLGGGILAFCVICLLIAWLMLRGRQADGLIVIKILGLILIICISAFLMVVGYGEAQLTPIVGLFGAIAGYLLGKEKPQGT